MQMRNLDNRSEGLGDGLAQVSSIKVKGLKIKMGVCRAGLAKGSSMNVRDVGGPGSPGPVDASERLEGWASPGAGRGQTFPWTPALSCSPMRIQNRRRHMDGIGRTCSGHSQPCVARNSVCVRNDRKVRSS